MLAESLLFTFGKNRSLQNIAAGCWLWRGGLGLCALAQPTGYDR
jgi:hypothetical protein